MTATKFCVVTTDDTTAPGVLSGDTSSTSIFSSSEDVILVEEVQNNPVLHNLPDGKHKNNIKKNESYIYIYQSKSEN